MRFELYGAYTYAKFGHLGAGHRIPLPTCSRDKIRALFPKPSGHYVGFHAAGNDPEEEKEEQRVSCQIQQREDNVTMDESPFF
jgi:hypothetical protein